MYNKGILKYIGAYAAYMNGVDVIVFTAGTLENSAVQRKLIVDNLGYLGIKLDENKNNFRGEERIISTDNSKVKVIVVPTNEELMIAKDTYKLVTSL
jgi:acetate kinase